MYTGPVAAEHRQLLHWAGLARDARIEQKQQALKDAQAAVLEALQRLRELYQRHKAEFTSGILRDIEVCKICASLEQPARRPHCFRCKAALDSKRHSKCPKCNGWIVCPSCGACGCHYDASWLLD
jgi:uncharacterized paraquat-inducible protein A